MKIGYLMQAGVPNIRQHPLTGPANHVKRVFEELRILGHHVFLLAYLDGKIWKTTDLDNFESVAMRRLDQGPVRLLEKGIRRFQSAFKLPYWALFESNRFAAACQQELKGFDLFYERMGWMGYGSGIAARRMRIPLVFEVNGDHLSEMEMLGVAPRGMQRQISIFLMDQAIRRASYIVATGEGWRRRLLERWHLAPDKIKVIENGSEIVNLLARDQLRSFLPIENDSGEVIVIYIGAFEPWHGVTILIRAMAKALARGARVRLVLVGSGKMQETICQLVRELGINECVTLTGHLPPQEYAFHLANADIGISAYCGRVEYSGLKLLDYKAAGLATIASGENGQPTVIEHGYTGWIVPPCEDEALCQAIVHLAENIELRREIGRRARIEAENFHSWRHTAEQLLELFSHLIAV